MANALFIPSLYPALQKNGDIAPMSAWTFYVSGGTVLADIYDADDAALPNPITADAFGRFVPIYLDATVTYRVLLENSTGVLLAAADPFNSATPSGGDFSVAGDILLTAGSSQVIWDVGGPRIGNPSANRVSVFNNGSPNERISIQSDGTQNFGGARDIGNGDIQGNGNSKFIAKTAGGVARTTYDTTNATADQFLRDVLGTPTQVGTITFTDTGTSFNVTSDQDMKEHVSDLSPSQAWDIIRLIQIHNFRWKHTGTEDFGVFAQQLFKLCPKAVEQGYWLAPDGTRSETEIEGGIYCPWGVDYSHLIPLLIVALQDAQSRLAMLEGAHA